MSDLDADLYGGERSATRPCQETHLNDSTDLYGNDEAEYSEQTEAPSKQAAEPAPVKQETPAPPQPATSSKPAAPAPVKAEAQPEASHDDEELHDLQSLNAAHDSAAYEEQSTQQIPTYQERSEPEYQVQTSAQHLDAGNFGVNRPVRPSEMKEEG